MRKKNMPLSMFPSADISDASLFRRNITVFSANLSAMNIGHGQEKKSSGPDLLLSYHDNDHYSSVRAAASKASKSKGDGEEKIEDDNCEQKVGKKLKSPKKDHEKGARVSPDEPDAKSPKKTKQSTSKPKKNAPCHCGSGKRYKNCCSSAEKRLQKGKGSDDSVKENEKAKDETYEMNGNFRVLQI